MTPDLEYLALTAGLCALLWMPYVVGLVKNYGLAASDYRTLPERAMPPWLKRAQRTHLNLVENLPIFASLVLVAHLSGAANSTTAIAAAVFFWARVAHAIVFLAGWPFVRTLAFVVSWVALLVILWQIFA